MKCVTRCASKQATGPGQLLKSQLLLLAGKISKRSIISPFVVTHASMLETWTSLDDSVNDPGMRLARRRQTCERRSKPLAHGPGLELCCDTSHGVRALMAKPKASLSPVPLNMQQLLCAFDTRKYELFPYQGVDYVCLKRNDLFEARQWTLNHAGLG